MSLIVIPGHAQTNLPPLELVVNQVDGPNASYRLDTAPDGAWEPLKEGRNLSRGDHVRTGDETSIRLEVPGITLLTVTPGTTMQLDALERSTEERGLLTTEEVTVNNIEVETEEGKVQNSVREHEGVATEYDLKTPNAVAGVRGTDFQCEVTDFGRTECAVGDGEVQFASRANPEQSVNLQAGQKSSMGPDATTPSQPEDVSDTEAEELAQVAEQSQQALALPPIIEGINLNGTTFQESIRIEYSEASELTLAGQAAAQDDGASLESVTATVNGEPATVEGTAEWTITRTPPVPPEGSEQTAMIEITATDSNDKSITRTIEVTLVNPEETGQAPSEIPPGNYEDGNVPVEVATLAGRPISELEFPYHAYQGDATSQGLMIEGTASGDATIEGVAYSLDGGSNWELATGSESWEVPIPAQSSGEYTVEVVAWTTDGVIGEPVEIGPIEYEAISYNQAIRMVFEEFWSEFANENANEALELVTSNFQAQFVGGDEEDASQVENFLTNELFPDVDNLRVDYVINQVFGTPSGGEITVGRLDWKGSIAEESEGQTTGTGGGSGSISLPFVNPFGGNYQFIREANGEFQFQSFEDVNKTPFVGVGSVQFEEFLGGNAVADKTGFFSGFGGASNAGFDAFANIFSGDVIVGLDGNGYRLSADSRAQIYTNNGQEILCSGCFPSDYPIQAGGVAKLNASSFSDVDEIPPIGSNRLQNVIAVSPGDIVAVNVENDFGEQETYLLEVLSYTANGNMDVRFVQPFDHGVTNFRGANPFR